MRKLTYICGAIIVATSMLCLIDNCGVLCFVLEFIPATVIFGCYPLCKEKMQYRTIQFFAIWVAGYDLVCIALRGMNIANLFTIPSQVSIQFGIPFMVAVVLKAKSGVLNKQERQR